MLPLRTIELELLVYPHLHLPAWGEPNHLFRHLQNPKVRLLDLIIPYQRVPDHSQGLWECQIINLCQPNGNPLSKNLVIILACAQPCGVPLPDMVNRD